VTINYISVCGINHNINVHDDDNDDDDDVDDDDDDDNDDENIYHIHKSRACNLIPTHGSVDSR